MEIDIVYCQRFSSKNVSTKPHAPADHLRGAGSSLDEGELLLLFRESLRNVLLWKSRESGSFHVGRLMA